MQLSKGEKISYGLGAVAKDMVYTLSASYVLYYYQDVLGVSAIVMGTIIMIAKIFDVFNDPIVGVIVAKTKSPWGRFRPWILIGTLINAVFLYLLYAAPPELSQNGLVAYAAIFYILWSLTYTYMDIPFWSMIPARTQGKEREKLSALGRTCASFGSALMTVVTMKCVHGLGQGNERNGFLRFSCIIVVFFVVAIIFTCAKMQENSTVNMQATTVGQMLRALIKNDQTIVVIFAIVLTNCPIFTTTNLLIYFFKYDFGGVDWYNGYTIYNMFGGVIQILAMMFLYPMVRKYLSMLQVLYSGYVVAIVGYGTLLFLACRNIKNIFIMLIPAFLIYTAQGMFSVMMTVFLANTVEYGEWKNKHRDESVIISTQTCVIKLSSGVATFITSLCLTLCKVSEDTAIVAEAVNTGSLMGLRLTMTVFPVLGFILSGILFYKKYILTEDKLRQITEEIKKKKKDSIG